MLFAVFRLAAATLCRVRSIKATIYGSAHRASCTLRGRSSETWALIGEQMGAPQTTVSGDWRLTTDDNGDEEEPLLRVKQKLTQADDLPANDVGRFNSHEPGHYGRWGRAGVVVVFGLLVERACQMGRSAQD